MVLYPPRKPGRPDHYEEWMCEKLIEMMSQGCSKIEVAASLGICDRETIDEYCEKHEQFGEAFKKGMILAEAWWEKHGRTNLNNKEFNSTLWYMNMKNRFKWSDRQESSYSVYMKQEDAVKQLKDLE